MRVLGHIERAIAQTRYGTLVVGLLAITLLKTGIWYIPNIEAYRALAQDPLSNPYADPYAQYLVWNWLGPALSHLAGATGTWGFFLFHLCGTLAFWLAMAITLRKGLDDHASRAALVIFAALPVAGTAFYWVGPGGLLLFLMTLGLTVAPRAPVLLLIGFLLGLQHFEQSFMALAALTFAVWIDRDAPAGMRMRAPLLLLGAIGGKLGLVALFTGAGMEMPAGRIAYLLHNFDKISWPVIYNTQLVLWAVLGLGWLVALRFADLGRRSLPFFLALAGVMFLLPLVSDQSRVMAVVTFPLVATYWLRNPGFLDRLHPKEVAALALVWAVLPWFWTWGSPQVSVLSYNIVIGLNRAFGWFDVPPDTAMWPF